MKIGFYGGKFFPMHKGHLYCIDVAANECDKVVVIMFINGDYELSIRNNGSISEELEVYNRTIQLERVCSLYKNVEFHVIDTSLLKLPDGSEDWDAETPLVREYVPHMNYVYSSEPSYEEYFKRAYPEAEHRIVDEKRIKYPISATMIRAMKTMEEKEKWMV